MIYRLNLDLSRFQALSLGSIQFLMWAIIQSTIHYAYRNAPGLPFYASPMENIKAHGDNPMATGISLLVIGILLYFVFKGWQGKPYLLRLSFVLLFPVFVGMYLVMGQAFEYRVFGEIYPVMGLLVMKGAT